MYQYTPIDQAIVDARVDEFRDQVARYQDGKLDDNEFLQLRLRNGLYHQRHAYMLRVAIPYGMLTSEQLRKLAFIADRYDKGFGHFTTRQNIQYNWPKLDDVPDILAELATVQMHAIQTSGNCVRNTTADHLAGVTADEVADPRPWCEMIRQWSTLNPEFNYLPRKFKIAVTGATHDRAAVAYHDIGLRLRQTDPERGDAGLRFEVIVGGGMGRTPIIGKTIRDDLEPEHLLAYVDAILRVYNLEGNRKNKYKARIKILVRTLGVDTFREKVEREFAKLKGGPLTVTPAQVARFTAAFPPPAYQTGIDDELPVSNGSASPRLARWLGHNVHDHKVPGYRAVTISLKSKGRPPGDATGDEMRAIADLADRFSFGELRVTHEQNLVLADVEARQLPALHEALDALGLGMANAGLVTDMICCPGLDYCNLANASSIPLAKELTERLDESDKLYAIGEVKLKMSGCVNACGHHHAGHIGILGVDKKGPNKESVEGYQILLGGSAEDDASIGRWIGPALDRDLIADAVEDVLDVYLEQRQDGERFLDTARRLGAKPFHDRVYEDPNGAANRPRSSDKASPAQASKQQVPA
jgi:sulfite reductase (NADPH) hemoprotein beta-component